MDFWNAFASLFSNFGNLTWQMVVMWGIGALLIYLAIVKKMEPSLLLPMGFGAILVNLPLSGAITQGDTVGPISALFEAGMSNELFPLLLFIGIGAMIDFGPLLEKPWLMLFGAAAQFGIFFTLFLAGFFFDLKDAASIAPVSDLFFVGRATTKKLLNLGIMTIGELAKTDPVWLKTVFKKQGEIVWNFAELANACMAVPNLICVLRLWKTVKEGAVRFESSIKKSEQRKNGGRGGT